MKHEEMERMRKKSIETGRNRKKPEGMERNRKKFKETGRNRNKQK